MTVGFLFPHGKRPMISRMLNGLATAVLLASLSMTVPAAAGESRWAQVNDVSLRYQIDGSGPSLIVMLPSTGKSLEYYDELLPMLMAPGRTILRYDIRGSGLSQTFDAPITMADEVGDLEALLEHLDFDGPILFVGTAFGGSIQMQYAARHPDRVLGIVNISPSARLEAPKPGSHPPLNAADPHARVYPPQLRSNSERWSRYLGIDASNDPVSRRFTEKLIVSTPFADVLPKVKCPTLFVATTLYPRSIESIQELADRMPDAQVASVESGHEAPLQTPELVAPILLEFFKARGI